VKILIVYYSMDGHIHRMAQAVAEGVKEVAGAEPVLRCVPETLGDRPMALRPSPGPTGCGCQARMSSPRPVSRESMSRPLPPK
jgi:multimeric flavodoxin WrbA